MILALVLAIATPSFVCRKAANEVERMICSDPQLARFDRFMASAFRSIKRDRYELSDQREFLARRNSCATRQCVREAYETILPSLLTSHTPGAVTLASRSNSGTLVLLDVGAEQFVFSVSGMWRTYGGSWNLAEGTGVVHLVNGKGSVTDGDQGCGVDLQRLAPRRWLVTRTPTDESIGCDGHNATITGSYR
ncbi:MAG: hypothetical protein ABI617_01210 [Sphingomicrobium sp.]